MKHITLREASKTSALSDASFHRFVPPVVTPQVVRLSKTVSKTVSKRASQRTCKGTCKNRKEETYGQAR